MSYSEDDLLPLSGIQHFKYCPRQWALIHIDKQWEDNTLTFEGQLLHKNVDNPFYRMKQGPAMALRCVHVASRELGLYGIMDLVELSPASGNNTPDKGIITIPDYDGRWIPFPVEYKHGAPKPDFVDEVQLAAQAMCLEEMYDIEISFGAFFYQKTMHRHNITFSTELRDEVRYCADEMHRLFDNLCIPKAVRSKRCLRCSLLNLCMPNYSKLRTPSEYIKKNLYEETT